MQAVEWTDISLVNIMVLYDFWVAQIRPVIAPEWPFIWSPSCESMDQNHRVIIGPLVFGQMVVASAFKASFALSVQARFFALIQGYEQLVKALDDVCKY